MGVKQLRTQIFFTQKNLCFEFFFLPFLTSPKTVLLMFAPNINNDNILPFFQLVFSLSYRFFRPNSWYSTISRKPIWAYIEWVNFLRPPPMLVFASDADKKEEKALHTQHLRVLFWWQNSSLFFFLEFPPILVAVVANLVLFSYVRWATTDLLGAFNRTSKRCSVKSTGHLILTSSKLEWREQTDLHSLKWTTGSSFRGGIYFLY